MRAQLRQVHEVILSIQYRSTASSAQKSTPTFTKGASHMNCSRNSISGPISLSRENTISKYLPRSAMRRRLLERQGRLASLLTKNLRDAEEPNSGCNKAGYARSMHSLVLHSYFGIAGCLTLKIAAVRHQHLDAPFSPAAADCDQGIGLRPAQNRDVSLATKCSNAIYRKIAKISEIMWQHEPLLFDRT
jgi:hypothetical protein